MSNPSSKRIAVIAHWGFQSLHGGNLRSYFFIRELLQRGYQVTVILSSDSDVEPCRRLFGCEAVSVNVPLSRWQPAGKKIIQYLIFGHKVKELLGRNSYDAVFGINLVQALPAVRQTKSQSWIMYVDLWADFFEYDAKPSLFNKILVRMVRWAEFYTMRKADKLVMITEAMRGLVPEDIAGKVRVIPDGADTRHFQPGGTDNTFREKYNLGSSPVFSYQGGIARHEGLDLICHAAPYVLEKLPDAKFLIAGQGDFAEECKAITRDNGSAQAFIFTGWVDYRDMPKLFSAVNVSLVPMPDVKAARPIISFKLLEAMASQTPVVVNGIPGPLEIVDETTAVVTKADDPRQFAEDMVRAYQLPVDDQERMTRKALEKIRSLDWREIARRDADYFAESVSSRAHEESNLTTQSTHE